MEVLPLKESALVPGRYEESDAYLVAEEDALAFDKEFPPREKHTGTPFQLRFLELVEQVKPAQEMPPAPGGD